MSLTSRIERLERRASSATQLRQLVYEVRLLLHHPFYLIATSPHVRVRDESGDVVQEVNGADDPAVRAALMRGWRVLYCSWIGMEVARDMPFPRLLAGLLWLHQLGDWDSTANAASAGVWQPLPEADQEVQELLRVYCERSHLDR